ncbi:CBS domain-containing protein [Plantactinospora sp. S1510]|uniref:CBS domain-containing protein n=1 Tax=Plantactinospora alkalitolerans TaxID=2789879 RepID=A0ABS0GQD2_9ACTN|nr:CBS domain-containing protein [Plantactinospora alkalitolerans]MBF9128395.1 CBS domain-containing protein [Plantactinospora alkalitolerans]
MPQWRVGDVMTSEVITAPDDASVAQIVTLLTDRQISAVPIIDRFDVVLGVVSWTDLFKRIEIGAPDGAPRASWWRRWVPSTVQWPAGTAVEVMSGPPLTIRADASLPAAARVMYRSGVGRLLVVDDGSRLRGIVTRSDLFKIHARLDAVIRDEVVQRVLGRTLRIPPRTVRVTVDGGVVTLAGRVASRTTAIAAARLTEAVPGVTDVVDRLGFDLDDTVAAAVPATEPDPMRGWLIGRPLSDQPAGQSGAGPFAALSRP